MVVRGRKRYFDSSLAVSDIETPALCCRNLRHSASFVYVFHIYRSLRSSLILSAILAMYSLLVGRPLPVPTE